MSGLACDNELFSNACEILWQKWQNVSKNRDIIYLDYSSQKEAQIHALPSGRRRKNGQTSMGELLTLLG
jgi:hypothetical protein